MTGSGDTEFRRGGLHLRLGGSLQDAHLSVARNAACAARLLLRPEESESYGSQARLRKHHFPLFELSIPSSLMVRHQQLLNSRTFSIQPTIFQEFLTLNLASSSKPWTAYSSV
jgi:hypothetical protein